MNLLISANYVNLRYEWANKYFAYFGRWPTMQDWEHDSTMRYYGASTFDAPADDAAVPTVPIGPEMPETEEETDDKKEGETPKAAEK